MRGFPRRGICRTIQRMSIATTRFVTGAERFAALHTTALPQVDELCGCFQAHLALRARRVRRRSGGRRAQGRHHPVAEPLQGRSAEGRDRPRRPLRLPDHRRAALRHGRGRHGARHRRDRRGRRDRDPDRRPVQRRQHARRARHRLLGVVAGVAGGQPVDRPVLGLAPVGARGARLPRVGRRLGRPGCRLERRALRDPARHHRRCGGSARRGRRHVPLARARRRVPAADRAVAAGLRRETFPGDGGIIAIVAADEEAALRDRFADAGLELRVWDNGSVDSDA